MPNSNNIKKILVVLLAIFVAALFLSPGSNPDFSPLYSLKRVQEKLFSAISVSPAAKADYYQHLLDQRLAEMDHLVKSQHYTYLWSSSLRYAATAGNLTDYIIANNLKDKFSSVTDQFNKHKQVLYDLYVYYPKNINNDEWKYVLDDINYLEANLEKLAAASKNNQ